MAIYKGDGSFRILARPPPIRRPSNIREVGEAIEFAGHVGEFTADVANAAANCVIQ